MPPRPRGDLVPYPYLHILLASARWRRLPPPMTLISSILVSNKGNHPSMTCYIEFYAGNYHLQEAEGRPLSEFSRHSYTIISLHAGEEREIEVPEILAASQMTWFAVLSDPLNDPKAFEAVDLSDAGHRQIALVTGTDVQAGPGGTII